MLLLRQERPLQPPLLKLTKVQKQEQRQQEQEEARRRKSKQHDERYAREWNGDPIELKHRWQEQEPATSAQSLANSPAGGRNLHASICACPSKGHPACGRSLLAGALGRSPPVPGEGINLHALREVEKLMEISETVQLKIQTQEKVLVPKITQGFESTHDDAGTLKMEKQKKHEDDLAPFYPDAGAHAARREHACHYVDSAAEGQDPNIFTH